ncbi:hypothetical protein [Parapedobacter sp. DT-150]|uniref:hypothetical protein n=1 Tax=Parapedobacter sp. DT-150 TaxID=3396162 RepID=UPI003F1B3E8A
MDNGFLTILSSLAIVALGIMAKYSSGEDGWKPLKKYWLFFVLLGLISLAIGIYRSMA